MTKKEACKLLGISQSAGKAKAERVFLKKHNELTYKLRPGNQELFPAIDYRHSSRIHS